MGLFIAALLFAAILTFIATSFDDGVGPGAGDTFSFILVLVVAFWIIWMIYRMRHPKPPKVKK